METRPTDADGARDTPPGGDVDPANEVVEATGVAMADRAGAAASAANQFHTRHGDFLQEMI